MNYDLILSDHSRTADHNEVVIRLKMGHIEVIDHCSTYFVVPVTAGLTVSDLLCQTILESLLTLKGDPVSVQLESLDLAMLASYYYSNIKGSYKINARKIPLFRAKDWYLIFNSDGLIEGNASSFFTKHHLPETYPKLADPTPCFSSIAEDTKLTKSIYIVGYYSEPFKSVGTVRAEYWLNYFKHQHETQAYFVSAIKNPDPNHIFVPDLGWHQNQEAMPELVKEISGYGIDIVGASWLPQLLRFFTKLAEEDMPKPDVLIVTGNPFYYFPIIEFVKNVFNSRVILDYRDPFANSPVMLRHKEVKKLQTRLEAEYNRNADLITVVNLHCKSLVVGESEREKVSVVENGFDESVYSEVIASKPIDSSRLQFVYAGSFSAYRNADNFSQALSETNHHLSYLGNDSSFGLNIQNIENHGFKSLPEAAKIIQESDIGIVFSTGFSFESTTKIYDYIGADIPILIVTAGELHSGALHDMTRNIEGIYWVKNDKQEIKRFIETTFFERVHRENREQYSRAYQSNKLMNILFDE